MRRTLIRNAGEGNPTRGVMRANDGADLLLPCAQQRAGEVARREAA
jgi:hypothetical protein